MDASLEKGHHGPDSSREHAAGTVVQPERRSTELMRFIEDVNRISENVSTRVGEDLPSQSTSSGATQTGDDTRMLTPRAQAIASLPVPKVMQRQLQEHIRLEVRKLRKEAKRVTKLGRPGAAHRLNQLYARMRSLNALLAEIFELSFEALRRLFVRVFIDRQTIL